jgi:hypothetical protein
VNGGLPCGEWNDLNIARSLVINQLDGGEKMMADAGYRDFNYFLNREHSPMNWIVMARHETCNSKIKNFKVLSGTYRHCIAKHEMCLRAVANLVQLEILNGNDLFDLF